MTFTAVGVYAFVLFIFLVPLQVMKLLWNSCFCYFCYLWITVHEARFDLVTFMQYFVCVFDESSRKNICVTRVFLLCQIQGFIYNNKSANIEDLKDRKQSLNIFTTQISKNWMVKFGGIKFQNEKISSCLVGWWGLKSQSFSW